MEFESPTGRVVPDYERDGGACLWGVSQGVVEGIFGHGEEGADGCAWGGHGMYGDSVQFVILYNCP